jgi:DNA-binding HxlR family transcriptional regulator
MRIPFADGRLTPHIDTWSTLSAPRAASSMPVERAINIIGGRWKLLVLRTARSCEAARS